MNILQNRYPGLRKTDFEKENGWRHSGIIVEGRIQQCVIGMYCRGHFNTVMFMEGLLVTAEQMKEEIHYSNI